jgi:hypothetical protein
LLLIFKDKKCLNIFGLKKKNFNYGHTERWEGFALALLKGKKHFHFQEGGGGVINHPKTGVRDCL